MLNDEDIIKLKSVFATKDDFKEMRSDILEFKKETSNNFLRLDGDISSIKTDIQEMKSDMAGLKELVQGLIISTDNIAKSISDLRIEYSAISTQLSRHELWIKQIAEKVGLKLVTE